jgi:hypothetical protein
MLGINDEQGCVVDIKAQDMKPMHDGVIRYFQVKGILLQKRALFL